MGAIQMENPHVKRSSSMSFALRWKHENVRMISIIAVFTVAVTFMFFMLLYGTATKSVSMVVNGKETVVKTKQWDLKHLLDEQAIVVGEHDLVSADLSSKVKNGDRITVTHALPIQLTADGETKTLYTTGKTVAEALTDLKVALGPDDKIQPSVESGISENGAVKIVRVKKQVEQQEAPIAFATETKSDPELLKGKEQVVREGVEGVKLIQKEKIFEDGSLVAESVLGESVQTESVNKLVAIGAKNPVTVLAAPKPQTLSKEGIPFTYKQMISNVTLTAYSAGPASTGKSAGQPGFGKTSTGTTVTEGRTIAVDPSVIPMGWWVYIEGIGYRRAEDTGSAVKGNKIDVYFDSESYANKFGLKRGYTVYVIGPKKPAAE